MDNFPKKKKTEICPICKIEIRKPNKFVKYHISYSPEITILACQYCNYTERALRLNEKLPYCGLMRYKKIILFHNKFGFNL